MFRMFKVYLSVGLAVASVALSAFSTSASAQTPPATLPSQPAQIDVVITRYQGDKKVSAAPFVMLLNAAKNLPYTTVESGLDVPIGTANSDITQTSGAQGSSPRAVRTQKVETTYRNIGTRISCSVSRSDESTYLVTLSVNDSRVLERDAARRVSATSTADMFRTFSHSSSLQIRDGDTRLFGMSTDPATGETMKIELKLTILK